MKASGRYPFSLYPLETAPVAGSLKSRNTGNPNLSPTLNCYHRPALI
jgi:hypothetical protein